VLDKHTLQAFMGNERFYERLVTRIKRIKDVLRSFRLDFSVCDYAKLVYFLNDVKGVFFHRNEIKLGLSELI